MWRFTKVEINMKLFLLLILSILFYFSCNAQTNGSVATLKIQENASIQLKRVHIHAFLAEYDRYLLLNVNGKTVTEVQISTDTGGYSRANVFVSNSDFIIVEDSMERYEINVERREITVIKRDCEYPKDYIFVGAFDTDETKKWQFIPASKKEKMPMLLSGCAREI